MELKRLEIELKRIKLRNGDKIQEKGDGQAKTKTEQQG